MKNNFLLYAVIKLPVCVYLQKKIKLKPTRYEVKQQRAHL